MADSPMSHLILVLPSAPASSACEYAFVLSEDGQSVSKHGQASAAALPASARSRRVTLIVPYTQLSWHHVTLPPGLSLGQRRQQGRVRAALDGLLEDCLLDEPQRLHLALEPNAVAGTRSWVAACDEAWLQSHLQALQAAGFSFAHIAPEIWPQAEPALWTAGETDAPWLLATGLDSADSLMSLPLAGGADGDRSALRALLQSVPAGTVIHAEPQTVSSAEPLEYPITLMTAMQRALAASHSAWDLAQFELDQGRQSRLQRQLRDGWQSFWHAPQWRAARLAMLIALIAQLVGLNAWAWKQNRAVADKQRQVQLALTDTFPKVPIVVDAPVQMQRELARLRSETGAISSADLEALLTASAQIPGIGGAQALDFKDQQLRIKGVSLEAEALADVQDKLTSLGYALQREGVDLMLTASSSGARS